MKNEGYLVDCSMQGKAACTWRLWIKTSTWWRNWCRTALTYNRERVVDTFCPTIRERISREQQTTKVRKRCPSLFQFM